MRIVTRRILMLLACVFFLQQSYAQNRAVSGKILDEKGLPLIGASITASGSKINALTDAGGTFTINVPATTRSLSISYIGMKTQDVSIAGKSTILVSLEPGEFK